MPTSRGKWALHDLGQVREAAGQGLRRSVHTQAQVPLAGRPCEPRAPGTTRPRNQSQIRVQWGHTCSSYPAARGPCTPSGRAATCVVSMSRPCPAAPNPQVTCAPRTQGGCPSPALGWAVATLHCRGQESVRHGTREPSPCLEQPGRAHAGWRAGAHAEHTPGPLGTDAEGPKGAAPKGTSRGR